MAPLPTASTLDGQVIACSLAAAQAIAAVRATPRSATVPHRRYRPGQRRPAVRGHALQDDEHNSVVASALSTVVLDARLFADGFE